MERFPVIVLFGAALIGWVAGETIVNDTILHDFVADLPWLHYVVAAAGALLVVAIGHELHKRALAQSRTAAH